MGENVSYDDRNSDETGYAYQRYMNKQKQKYGDDSSKNPFTSRKTGAPSEPLQHPHKFRSGNCSAPFSRVHLFDST